MLIMRSAWSTWTFLVCDSITAHTSDVLAFHRSSKGPIFIVCIGSDAHTVVSIVPCFLPFRCKRTDDANARSAWAVFGAAPCPPSFASPLAVPPALFVEVMARGSYYTFLQCGATGIMRHFVERWESGFVSAITAFSAVLISFTQLFISVVRSVQQSLINVSVHRSVRPRTCRKKAVFGVLRDYVSVIQERRATSPPSLRLISHAM